MPKNTHDIIVVGAGHNGLTAASYMAKAGLDVLVLEKNEWIGGAAVSRELFPGWKYSNCSYVCSLLRPEIMRDLEAPIQSRLIERLQHHSAVRIIGTPSSSIEDRVATISFIHERHTPSTIVAAAHAANVGIRNGNMYAYRLCEAMGIPVEEGVVRVSAVHYNTIEEIDVLMDALDPLLAS